MANKSYKAVVFDWDGTLMDSTNHIVRAITNTCQDMGMPKPSHSQASWVIGMSLQSALYKLVPDLNADNVEEFIKLYQYHSSKTQLQVELFPGQVDLLKQLHAKNIMLAVATGKTRPGLDVFLQRLGLVDIFQVTKTVTEANGKPDPDMLQQIMLELDLAPESIIMVGDTTHDIFMAHAAGIDSMAVAYGAHSKEELLSAKPTILLDSVGAMQNWLIEHTRA